MLTLKNLGNVESPVHLPDYNPLDIKAGIVHFGVGNFFRAHEALYIDKILKAEPTWGIIGVGLTQGDHSTKKAAMFQAQDCLYSLTECAPSGDRSIRIIAALRDYLLAPQNPQSVLEHLTSPDIHIVSMTITEGGYNINEVTGLFDLDTPAVKNDLQNPTNPTTVFGYVVEGLRRRRDAGLNAFTIMSCDNLRHNGDVARKAFLGFAQARDPELADWIARNATFPNSMVDRITPTVTADIAKQLNTASGLDDALPVVAEDFHQWVLEDKFADGRPDLAHAGVQFVSDVTDYEHVKIRMLNASHIMLCFPAILLGYEHVDQAVKDPALKQNVENFLTRDVIPTLKAPPGVNLQQYMQSVLSRFSNPAMADQTLRIASDGCAKIQVFWTQTVRDLLLDGKDCSRIAFGMAAYLEMLRGVNALGQTDKTSEPAYTAEQEALIRSDDYAAGLKLPAFDAWRDLDSHVLDQRVVELRKVIRAQGIRAALSELPR
ncbi:mannitol dehydrogenase family protein [Acetobacter lambici]|uniref:Mannitol dehydrogenase family protein n=1 Tax=Acetobacter lambici TaxID=1332824 RepID=A0ABT1F3Q2_9PROT|nr:mannitol dehydrogenase family protein [Acetobacter lambici]MCP1243728.1 mannitol dehydrogenase family protein [Acetobacter lambici]MCP1259840.1 mannitol dehydrogenase family protein [Acetobacter lambici]NHO57981.1 mannitol dehydrogenase family protein [Acetobacter lambici]